MALTITFELNDRDLALLSDLINSKARTVAATEAGVIAAARELLAKNEGTQVPDFIRQRMNRLSVLISMLEDQVWELSGDDRTRIVNALSYFADPNDIIPDDVPGFGLLDDAVVIELVVQALRHDIEAYEDFCKFRKQEEERRGKTVDPLMPDQWLKTRRAQLHDRMRRRRSSLWESRLGRTLF